MNPNEVADTRPCLSELHVHEGPTVPTAEDVFSVTWGGITYTLCGEMASALDLVITAGEFDPDGRQP